VGIGKRYGYGTKKLSSEGIFLPKKAKERNIMSNSNNNQINIPQAREAMDRFKMQAAQEVGVNLTNGYNGHLTSREAGSVGGQMVKKMIEAYEQGLQ
jgi:small acid-soluble spore protein D (minor alpha/beta-type SASP)